VGWFLAGALVPVLVWSALYAHRVRQERTPEVEFEGALAAFAADGHRLEGIVLAVEPEARPCRRAFALSVEGFKVPVHFESCNNVVVPVTEGATLEVLGSFDEHGFAADEVHPPRPRKW
jgi:hypothetical protein